MPIVHIHVQRGRWAAERTALLEGVHAALVEAFEIPESDRNQMLHEHEPDHFEAQRGAGFAIVEITAFPGRSAEAKRRLYAAVVRNLARAGVAPEDVLIVLHEPPLESWGIRGGKAASDVDLGFKRDV